MKLLSKFETHGNIELLSQKIVAVFSSKDTPKEIYPSAEQLFEKMTDMPISMAGGWQAPLEKKLLETAHPAMKANIIYYTAKDLSQVKMGKSLELLDNEKKLLLVSAQSRQIRATKSDVDKRDALLFNQISQVLFLYISPNGRLEKYYNTLQESNFSLFVLDHPLNEHILISGCPAINSDNLQEII
jgi:hypothetical protein